MKGLLYDGPTGHAKHGPRWTVEQDAILLNMYFSGICRLIAIARATGRGYDVPAVERRILEFLWNYRHRRKINYVPFNRIKRVNHRWNQKELRFFRDFQAANEENEENIKYLSDVMQRSIDEIKQAWKSNYRPGMKIQSKIPDCRTGSC